MTDYRPFFSEDVPSFLRSPVRDIFAKVDLSAICSFGERVLSSFFSIDSIFLSMDSSFWMSRFSDLLTS